MKPRVVFVANAEPLSWLGEPIAADFIVHLRFGPSESFDRALTRARAAGVSVIASVLPDVMREKRLDGIHLGGALRAHLRTAREELGPDAWISVPAHTDEEVEVARRDGASAVYVSPIFETPGKGPPRGLRAIRRARELAGGMLVYALGGVDASNAEACAGAGADGVAVIRAVLDAASPPRALEALAEAVKSGHTRCP